MTDGMLTAASLALADYTGGARLAQGALYPRIDRLRAASRQVAMAVIRQAVKEEVATRKPPEDLEGLLEAEMWRPEGGPRPASDIHSPGAPRLQAIPSHQVVFQEHSLPLRMVLAFPWPGSLTAR